MTQPQTTYRVLARKYRPARLLEVIGQEEAVTLLDHCLTSGRIPQALIFTGIRGIGKTTLARLIAKGLNCTGPEGMGQSTVDPCGVCASCVAINEDRHLDVVEMDAASHTSVDDVRDIIEASRYATVSGRYKVYIIDEVHMLSKSAFNALLKTLEEPPAHVKFIFATTELHKVPKTVLSRCVRLQLKRMDPLTLFTHLQKICRLEKVEADDEALRTIVRASEGSVRDSLSLLDQAITLCDEGKEPIMVHKEPVRHMIGTLDHQRLLDLYLNLLEGRVQEVLTLYRSFYDEGLDPQTFFHDLIRLIHLTTLLTTETLTPEAAHVDSLILHGLSSLKDMLSVPVLSLLWQGAQKAEQELAVSSMPFEAGEMLLIRLCHLAQMPPLTAALGKSEPTKQMDVASNDLSSFDALLALMRQEKEVILHHHLYQDIHLVKFEPQKVTLRLTANAPKDLLKRLTDFLKQHVGHGWQVVTSPEAGMPTLAEQAEKIREEQFQRAKEHPVVKSVLTHFPDAEIKTIETA